MLALLSGRLRVWLLFALGIPLLAWLLGFVGKRIEARTGSTRMTRALGKAGGWLGRRSRGPLAPHQEA